MTKTRRELFRQGILVASTFGTGRWMAPGRAATDGLPALPPEVIDSHTHFYDPSRPEGVPWPPPDDKVLRRTVLPAEWERVVAPLGVTGTVAVEASPWVEDTQWLLDLAERHGVAQFDPLRRQVIHTAQFTAAGLAQLHDRADELTRRNQRALDHRLVDLAHLALGPVRGVGDDLLDAVLPDHPVDDVG